MSTLVIIAMLGSPPSLERLQLEAMAAQRMAARATQQRIAAQYALLSMARRGYSDVAPRYGHCARRRVVPRYRYNYPMGRLPVISPGRKGNR